MQTRRDLYQAHKLMMQRVGLALLQGEPDVAESPMRRVSVSAFSGAMVALLIAAIFGVWGLLSPGGATGLDKGGMVIIEKETGTKYVYDTNAKKLRPVANYASARLALNSGNVQQRVVSRKSLAKFERGPMIGIQGAPDSLPDADHLVKKPWSVCVRNGTTEAGGTAPATSLVAGKSVGGRALGGNEAVAVQAGGQSYVIWNNQRMRMTVPPNQATSVTRGVQPAPVSQTWLNTIDQGPDFAAPPVANRGARVAGLGADFSVGQVFQAQPTGSWHVLLSDGFAPISHTQSVLLLADPATKAAYHGQPAVARTIDIATVNSRLSRQSLLDRRLPPTIPAFVQWDGSTPLCAVYADTDKGSVTPRLSIGGSVPDATPGTAGQSTVDQVVLPPGSAALVGLLPGPNQLNAINTWYIVDDAGVKFRLSSKDTVEKLGYKTEDAAPIPQSVLQLMPAGPTLDPKAARMPVPAPKAAG